MQRSHTSSASHAWHWSNVWPRLSWGAVLLLLLGLVLWLQQRTADQSVAVAAVNTNMPDYQMQRFVWQRFESNGKPQWQIEGRDLLHFPDGRMRMSALEALQSDARLQSVPGAAANGVLWLRADEGWYQSKNQQLTLQGKTQAHWRDASGAMRLEMEGSQWVWNGAARHLSSQHAVRVLYLGQSWQSNGFVYDMAQGRLQLLGATRLQALP